MCLGECGPVLLYGILKVFSSTSWVVYDSRHTKSSHGDDSRDPKKSSGKSGKGCPGGYPRKNGIAWPRTHPKVKRPHPGTGGGAQSRPQDERPPRRLAKRHGGKSEVMIAHTSMEDRQVHVARPRRQQRLAHNPVCCELEYSPRSVDGVITALHIALQGALQWPTCWDWLSI